MAFSKGEESREASNAKRYIGVASVNVIGICPNKAELEGIFNTQLEQEPAYTGTADSNGKQVEFARVDVVLKTVPENNNGVEATSRMALFVRKAYRFNRDNTKVQVIDKYGRTAWVTQDELKTHAIPVYKNGLAANLDADYRPCYQGEEELTEFFKAFLNIPNCMSYKDKKWVMADNLDVCEARFDNLDKLFKGDFSEIKAAWENQKNNKVKVLYGIRTAQDGRQFQNFYTRMFLKNGQSQYERLEADVKATQEAGGMSTSTFLVNDSICPLQEYNVDSTPLNESASQGDNPFGNPQDNPFFQQNN